MSFKRALYELHRSFMKTLSSFFLFHIFKGRLLRRNSRVFVFLNGHLLRWNPRFASLFVRRENVEPAST